MVFGIGGFEFQGLWVIVIDYDVSIWIVELWDLSFWVVEDFVGVEVVVDDI